MQNHDFNESLHKGDKGERILLRYLNSRPSIEQVEDVTGNPEYQDKDIDFLIHFTNGTTQSLEIKADFYRSPNIFYETLSAVETNSPGCLEKTEAERLAYYFVEYNILYIFDMAKLREWVHLNWELFESRGYTKTLKNYRYDGNKYTSKGFAIPRTIIEDSLADWMVKTKIDLRK